MTRLGPNKKNRYSTLRCMNKYCDNISAPIYSIEDEIVQFLREWLDQEQLIFEKKELKQEPESAQILSKQIENIRLNVAELKSQLDKTYDLLERGLYSEEIFLQRNKKLTKQIKEQETHADELQDTLTTVLENHKRMNVWFPQTMKLIESYDINDAPEFRNSILKQLIQKVTYLKTEKNHRGTVDNRNFQLNIIPKLPHMSESNT